MASMIVNCYHHLTNKFPYHSTYFEMYTVTRGFTWWRQNYPSFSFSLASMIVNCYHHVTNKFPYHSTCFEMYTVTWGFTWWRPNFPSFFIGIDDRNWFLIVVIVVSSGMHAVGFVSSFCLYMLITSHFSIFHLLVTTQRYVYSAISNASIQLALVF